MAGAVQASFAGRAVEAGKLCAAVVSLVAPKAGNAGNPILSQVMSRYLRREFTLLQIGAAR